MFDGQSAKGANMDKETIKKKWIEMLTRLFREEWMDDDDYDKLINEFMPMVGGWEKLYEDFQIGVNNGYTEEQQFLIMEKLLLHGTKES